MAGNKEKTFGDFYKPNADDPEFAQGVDKVVGKVFDKVGEVGRNVIAVQEESLEAMRANIPTDVPEDFERMIAFLTALPPTGLLTAGERPNEEQILGALKAAKQLLEQRASSGGPQSAKAQANLVMAQNMLHPAAVHEEGLQRIDEGMPATPPDKVPVDMHGNKQWWRVQWATPGRPDNNHTIRLKNLGGLSGGVWGKTVPGTSVDSFETVPEGVAALVGNQSSHIERTGERRLVHGNLEYSLTGGVTNAPDLIRVHAPEWKWVKQNNGMFKRVWENDTEAYIESYTRTAKALGTWNDGAVPTDGDAFLVMALVISSKESGYALPQSPMDLIKGIGMASKAGPRTADPREEGFLKEWAKTAANRWHFERLEDGHVLIIRYDDDGTELGRVEMNAAGAPRYNDDNIGTPPHPVTDAKKEGSKFYNPAFLDAVQTKPQKVPKGDVSYIGGEPESEQGPPEVEA